MTQKLWGDENIYRTLLDNLPQNIFLKDGNSVYLSCNENYARALKIKAEEIAGKTDYEFYPTELAEKYRADDKRIMESGKAEEIEEKYIQEGKEFIVQTVKTPIKDEQGNVIGILGVFWDITERKKAEETIRESSELYHALFEQANDAIFLMENEYFIDCNERTLKMFDVTREQIINQAPIRFSPEFQADGRRSAEKALEKIRAAYAGEPQFFEWIHTRLDGTPFDAEVSLGLIKIGGRPLLQAIVRNITNRKKAEEALRESEERYKNLFKANIDGILIADPTTKKFRYANPAMCRILGYSEEELTQMGVADIHPKESLEQVFAEFEAFASGAKITAEDLLCVRKDGQVISVSINAGEVMIDQTKYLLAIFRDITERKQTEEKLKKLNEEMRNAIAKLEDANQELKNFVYIASHDMREPLRKITAFGTILEESFKGKISNDDAENLHFMIDGAQRMAKMIEGLLVYSRVSTQAQPHQAVDLNEIVKQLQQLELSVLLEEKQAVIEIPQPLPCVEVDPVQIRQLMQNIIANGVKYQKKGNIPHITITSKPAADGMVKIEVTDNGIGIAPEFQQTIFTMFRRLHSRDEYEGIGIGLAVCKKIVERDGGKIGVESQTDKGSTFWFIMPTAEKLAIAATEVKSHV